MPEFEIRSTGNIEDDNAILKKTLIWLLNNLDDMNVKRLRTEYCQIQSADGETQISGPLIVMYDKQATPVLRLKMGYDSVSGAFVFKLFDASGVNNIDLDGTGKGVITGGTIRTAASGERVELSGNALKTYNSSNQLNGLVTNATSGQHFGDGSFYEQGLETFRIQSSGTQQGWSLIPQNGGTIIYVDPVLSGNVQHASYSKIGFFGATPASKTAVSTLTAPTASAGTDTVNLASINSALSTLTNKINEIRNALSALGLV